MMTIVSLAAGAGLISGAAVEAVGLALRYRKIAGTALHMLQLLKPYYTEEELRELERNLSAAATVDLRRGV